MDDPQAYIAADRRRAIAAGVELPTRVRGAALFADISGFTPLTETLARELGPRRGADELSTVLGVVFEALLSRLHAHGGDVISFSGDAVTCWLDGDDGLRAVACGLAMQEAMADVGRVVTPSGTTVDLRMKVAVAVGEARRLVVGDHRVQLVDVLAGRLVDHLAAAERRATTGTVTLDASALDALGARADVDVLPADHPADHPAHHPGDTDLPGEATGRRVGVLRGLRVRRPAPMPWEPPPDLPEHVVRQWLLPQVYERMQSGRGEFLAELRPAVPLFVSFGGIDYDTDPSAHAKLDEFVMEAQRVVDAYGGSTLQLTLGDKGAYLYAVFGSPLAHEDDAARACAAALELRALEGRTSATDLRIGIATGRLRSGTYGHPTRRTFCCLGDAVNVAARLMSAAAPGEIIVDGRVHRAAEDRFAWRRLAPLAVKGKSAAIQAHALEDVRAGGTGLAARLAVRFTEPMVGRVRELAVVTEVVADVAAGSGRVLEIMAEAGMGKSRLVAEMVRVLSRSGVAVHVGESPSFGAGTSYAAWRDVWWDLLGLGGLDPDDLPAVTSALRARLESVDPGLVSRLPLLGALLDLALPDTDLTSGFDAKLRKTSLEDLAVRIVTHQAPTAPLALVVEDSHWMDPLSRDLLTVLAQAAAAVPLVVVVAYRPAGAGEPGTGLEVLAHRRALELEALDDEVVAALVRSLVRARTPDAGDVPEVLVERVVERSAGNPFYVEELVTYLLERADGRFTGVETLDMPESLAALVLSRIDTLAEGPRTTAKVASVVGRSFTGAALRAVHPDLGDRAGVDADLDVLREVDLLTLDDAATRLHAFRHVIVRDVAYESMPHGVRTRLHERAGDHVAATASTAGGQLLDLVAYHYVRGGDDAKKRSALLAAGAAAQARYANTTAIEHYRAVLPLLDDAARGAVLLALGQVLELTAAWDDADRAYAQARALADAAGDRAATGWSDVALAEVARKQGRFADAEHRLAEAADAFTAFADEVGLGRVLHLRGTLAAQQGRYDDARAHYEASLVVRERLGDRAQAAALLSNLGVIAEYTGDYGAARSLNEQALALRTQVGDRWAIGVSQNNLGMIALLTEDFADAKARFTEAMRLNLEVGDAWMVAIAHNNLANALRGLGDLDGARAGYARALEAYLRWDDRWALAILLEDVAVTAARLGDRPDALRLLGAAETLRAEIGSPRSPSDETGLAEVLTPAGPADGPLLDAGRSLTLPAAADLARAVCR